MRQYLELLSKVRREGELRPNRTAVPTYSVFGHQLEIDLQQGFPLLTTKKVHFPSVVHELLWFISGSTNIKYLNENNVSIWDEWADAAGELGPVYGHQWRSWGTADGQQLDQLQQLINGLRADPYSRRHIISAWNVGELPRMALAPCHVMFQFFVGIPARNGSTLDKSTKPTLSCHLYQRSADLFLGVPFNIASYSLLTMMLAHVLDMRPGKFIHSFGDVHLYSNHLTQADEQLSRRPKDLPRLKLDASASDIFSMTSDSIQLLDYNPLPGIKAPIAV